MLSPRPPGRPSAWGRRAALLSCISAWAFGCASVLGVDGEYELEDSVGGRASGGKRAAGGTPASNGGAEGTAGGNAGGGSSSGGTPGAGGSTGSCLDVSDCEADEKCCGGTCVTPSADVGCSLAECTPCPEPIPNAEAFCQAERCTGRCLSGFEPADGACVREGQGDAGSGGSPGAGGSNASGGSGPISGGAPGSGGSPAVCTRETCPPCTNPLRGIIPCCERTSNACGCSWFDPVYCVD